MGFHIRYTRSAAVVYSIACTAMSINFSFKYMNKSNIVIINHSVVIYHVNYIVFINLFKIVLVT